MCYSVKISPCAQRSHLQIEDLEADVSSSLLCHSLGPMDLSEDPVIANLYKCLMQTAFEFTIGLWLE